MHDFPEQGQLALHFGQVRDRVACPRSKQQKLVESAAVRLPTRKELNFETVVHCVRKRQPVKSNLPEADLHHHIRKQLHCDKTIRTILTRFH